MRLRGTSAGAAFPAPPTERLRKAPLSRARMARNIKQIGILSTIIFLLFYNKIVSRKSVSYIPGHEPPDSHAFRFFQGLGQKPDRDSARGARAPRSQARRYPALSRDRRGRAARQGSCERGGR